MLHAHIVDRSELKQSFGLNLVLAMAFALPRLRYEFAKMPNVAHANAWQIASIIGQMVTLLLTEKPCGHGSNCARCRRKSPNSARRPQGKGEAAPREGGCAPRAA